MSNQTDALLKESREESLPTRHVLERIPVEHLGWKPHPTSAAQGALAMHVAIIPGQFASLLQLDEVDVAAGVIPRRPQQMWLTSFLLFSRAK